MPRRLRTAARWPAGIALTAWSYMWRITPMHRTEHPWDPQRDEPPAVTAPVALDEVQRPSDGVGPLMRRRYRVCIADAEMTAGELMADLSADPNRVAPGGLARFEKVAGAEGRMAVGDEFTVRMPGPWDGPVRVVDVTAESFRFATLAGHIEAGQIEWRARDEDGRLIFEIESWSSAGDRMSYLMHHTLRMAKEVQLHMWTSVLERAVRRARGRRDGRLRLETWVADREG